MGEIYKGLKRRHVFHVATDHKVRREAGSKSESTTRIATFALILVSICALYGCDPGRSSLQTPNPAPATTAPVISDTDMESLVTDLDKSIAVLPFVALSTDPDEQLFADGFADTLLQKLVLLEDIRVIARTSSFRYRGETMTVKQIGEALRAATLLTGDIQRNSDQLHITARLVNTADGKNIWSQTFDGSPADVFSMHTKIVDAVVKSLQISLSAEATARHNNNVSTWSFEAYRDYLLANEQSPAIALDEPDLGEPDPGKLRESADRFLNQLDAVLAIDPQYADAHRARARTYTMLAGQSHDAERRQFLTQQGFEALNDARRLDPDNPRNLLLSARLARSNGALEAAEAAARAAFARLPNDAEAVSTLADLLLIQGTKPLERLELAATEAVLDPGNTTTWRKRALALEDLGRNEDAEETIQAALAHTMERQQIAPDLAKLYGHLGQHVDAAKTLLDNRGQYAADPGARFHSAWIDSLGYVGLYRDMEQALNEPGGREQRLPQTIALAQVLFAQNSAIGARRWLQRRTREQHDPALSFVLGQVCFELGDFECAINSILADRPNLADSPQQAPNLQRQADFEAALTLAFSYRNLMHPAAEQRLINAMADFIESRTTDGYMRLPFYYWPKWHLLLGYRDTALDQIRDHILLEDDAYIPLCSFCSFDSPMFESVHGDPRFQILVAEYHRRKAAAATRIQGLIKTAGL